MESSVIKRCKARKFACGGRAGKACTGNTCARQRVARQEEHPCGSRPGPCGFCACRRETYSLKVRFFIDRRKEESGEAEAKINIQNEMKTLPDKLPHEKDCLPSVARGCILLLESRARM